MASRSACSMRSSIRRLSGECRFESKGKSGAPLRGNSIIRLWREIIERSPPGQPTASMSNKGYRITASTGIHKGDREYQQDQIALVAHPRINGCVLGVVADGMGGRSGGRKASDQVMMTCKQLFERYSPASDDTPAVLKQ